TFLSASQEPALRSEQIMSAAQPPSAPNGCKTQAADKNVCPTSPPPPRDCSPASEKNHSATAQSAASPDVKPIAANASAELPPATAAARRAFLAPAHPAPLTGDLPVTELKITPQQLAFPATPTRSVSEGRLSRRERRRLKRKLGA